MTNIVIYKLWNFNVDLKLTFFPIFYKINDTADRFYIPNPKTGESLVRSKKRRECNRFLKNAQPVGSTLWPI